MWTAGVLSATADSVEWIRVGRMKKHLATFPDWMRRRFSDAQRFVILCVIAGLLCGLASVAFHLAIDSLFHGALHLAHGLPGPLGLLFLTIMPALGGLLVGWVISWRVPEAAGSGIPQTKAAYYNNFGRMSLQEGGWRFALGAISVGLGNALGREGPTVHFCAAIASSLGRMFGLAKARVQGMVPAGMGAGIAAAFNAPLSAILFVFEELLDDFSTKALSGIVVAVVIAAATSRMILGEEPILHIDLGKDIHTAPWMLVAVPLGFVAALVGTSFVRGLLVTRAQLKRLTAVPAWLKPAMGGLLCGLVGSGALLATDALGDPEHGVFSIGYETLTSAFDNRLVLGALVVLFFAKAVAVIACYAAGGSGGLFSPTLFLGGMLGGIFGLGLIEVNGVVDLFWGAADGHVVAACVLLGMGALFASIIRCPFTSLVIIFEMTRDYNLILPLMAGNMLAYFLSRRLHRVSLYNALLCQDGINLRKMPAYQGARDYQNLPVATIMTYEAVTIPMEKNAAQALAYLQALHKNHHGYPVVDEAGNLRGVVMHHELEEQAERGNETRLGTHLAKQRLITVTPETSIREAAGVMIREDVLQVPVVNKSRPERLLGILTLHDIARQQNTVMEQIGR